MGARLVDPISVEELARRMASEMFEAYRKEFRKRLVFEEFRDEILEMAEKIADEKIQSLLRQIEYLKEENEWLINENRRLRSSLNWRTDWVGFFSSL